MSSQKFVLLHAKTDEKARQKHNNNNNNNKKKKKKKKKKKNLKYNDLSIGIQGPR